MLDSLNTGHIPVCFYKSISKFLNDRDLPCNQPTERSGSEGACSGRGTSFTEEAVACKQILDSCVNLQMF